MKMSHRLASSPTAGPVWGLLLGMLMSSVGAGLWWHATVPHAAARLDESSGVAALLIGVFLTIYAAREISHKRR